MRSGYAITIKGFVWVDQKDLADHRTVLDAISLAFPESSNVASNPGPMFARMDIEDFVVRPVQRRAKEGGA